MKFDYVIGNPPYQENSAGEKISDAAIYDAFMDVAYSVSEKVELVTPARFLFDNGNTPKAWNKKMLQDEHFKVLEYEADSSKVFPPPVNIKGGVAIHYRDASKNFGAIECFTAFPELNDILKKVSEVDEMSITSIIYNQNRFNLELLYEDYPDLKKYVSSDGKEKRITSGSITYKCFHDEKGTDSDIKIYGYADSKRVIKYIDKKYVDDTDNNNLNNYKVIIPANSGNGKIGEEIGNMIIGEPREGYTQTFISFGCCDDEKTVKRIVKYLKSKFARVMLSVLKVTQNGKKPVWKYVPLQDFTEESDIDWSKSIKEIDQQLYKKYGLSKEEIEFIETNVKEMV